MGCNVLVVVSHVTLKIKPQVVCSRLQILKCSQLWKLENKKKSVREHGE